MNKMTVLGNYEDLENKNNSYARVYDVGGIIPTIGASHFGAEIWIMEKVRIKQNNKQGFAECEVGGVANFEQAASKTRRGRVIEQGKISPTILTENEIVKIESGYRIRKLTPRECWRLMGFTDQDFDKASKVVSNSQLYKQAGNSIVVDVLENIFKQML